MMHVVLLAFIHPNTTGVAALWNFLFLPSQLCSIVGRRVPELPSMRKVERLPAKLVWGESMKFSRMEREPCQKHIAVSAMSVTLLLDQVAWRMLVPVL